MGETLFELSPLLQYINIKTRSADRGSKSRSSFANLYAIYVLVLDYTNGQFHVTSKYSEYAGADFMPLLQSIRKLPFGEKLQNHALNNRTNDEYHKYFPEESRKPVIRRDVTKQKYWINESLLIVEVGKKKYNIASSILSIIDRYVEIKRKSFAQFILDCEALKSLQLDAPPGKITTFIKSLLAPERDARIFEIVSYSILKAHFGTEIIWIGKTRNTVKAEILQLYKTGRTNANDGGIDFVMRPLGRFFQVTETLDVKKYFLDINKVEHFPTSFVIKTQLPVENIYSRLEAGAKQQFQITEIVKKYMGAIEEVFNIPLLLDIFDRCSEQGKTAVILDEIIKWSRLEFNYVDEKTDPNSVADEDEDE